MDFTKYITNSVSALPQYKVNDKKQYQNQQLVPHKLEKQKNILQRLTDPYIRRYHLITIMLNGLTAGLAAHFIKLTFENIIGKKLYKFSPWIQILVGLWYINWSLDDKFPIIDLQQKSQQELEVLSLYNKTHHFNSQYWH